jgi:hypothetical protein
MSNSPNQIKTVGATKINYANNPISSKLNYSCANALITRGVTSAPTDLKTCIEKFPQVGEIAQALGVTSSNLWFGPGPGPTLAPAIFDTLLGVTSEECDKVNGLTYGLGPSWLGCLWGSPMSSFSCTCPSVGQNFANYLKLRLNVATFWNTPITAPPLRNEFLDSIKYAKKVNILVAGDFNLKPGQLIELKVKNLSSYPSPVSGMTSLLNEKYYILTVKHTVTNTGVHETFLTVAAIADKQIIEEPITNAGEGDDNQEEESGGGGGENPSPE